MKRTYIATVMPSPAGPDEYEMSCEADSLAEAVCCFEAKLEGTGGELLAIETVEHRERRAVLERLWHGL